MRAYAVCGSPLAHYYFFCKSRAKPNNGLNSNLQPTAVITVFETKPVIYSHPFSQAGFDHPQLFHVLPCNFNKQESIQVSLIENSEMNCI